MTDSARSSDRERLLREIKEFNEGLRSALNEPTDDFLERVRAVLEGQTAKVKALLEIDPSSSQMLFGNSKCSLPIEGPCRSIEPIEQFGAFLRGLPAVLPDGCELELSGPDDQCAEKIRKVALREHVFEGGVLSPRRSDFRVLPSAGNIELLCEIQAIEPTPGFAMGIRAYHGQALVMDWYEWFSHPAWFSAAVDADELQLLAHRCGAKLVGPFLPGEVEVVDGLTLLRERGDLTA